MRTVIALATLLWCATAAFAAPPVRTADHAGEKIFTDAKGMTLYTFDKDKPGKSNCNSECAANWPPLMAATDAKPEGNWTIVTREDGEKMWAHDGRPVYRFTGDKKPGDTKGNNFGGAWHLVKAH